MRNLYRSISDMGNARSILIVLFILLFTIPVFGADNHYILDGGSGDGSAWNNAWNDLPATLTRGDTYYIGDGTYGAYTFNDAESTTEWIYIKKATEEDHGTETGWSSAYGDGEALFTDNSLGVVWDFTTGYWDINGQKRTNWTSGYGIRITTTTTYATDPSVYLLRIADGAGKLADYFVFKYIDFDHRVDRDNDCADDGIYSNATDGDKQGVQYCTISYSYIHNASRVLILTRNIRYWTVEYCYLSDNYSRPAVHGAGWSAGGGDDVVARYNIWVDVCGTAIHDLKGNKPEWEFNDWEVYGNLIYHTDGYNIGNLSNGLFHQTSPHGGTAESGTSNTLTDTDHIWTVATNELVGNLLTLYSGTGNGQAKTITANTDTGGGDTDIVITIGTTFSPAPDSDTVFYYSKGTHNAQIYNNTAYNITYFSGVGATDAGIRSVGDHEHTGNVAYNNLWYNCSVSSGNMWKSVDTHDYNWFYHTRQYNAGVEEWNDSTLAGLDTNGQLGTDDPFTDSSTYDLTLAAATEAGKTLSSPYNVDMFGNTRGDDGVWDRGANEYDSATPTVPTKLFPAYKTH